MIDKDSCKLVDGTVVVECDERLTPEQYETLKAGLAASFPGRRVAVLNAGLKLHVAQHDAIARIEQRIEAIGKMLSGLIHALAQDEQDEPQAFDLSGQPLPRERGENEPL